MVLDLSTKAPDVEAPREELFKIDGVPYTIPVDVPAVEGVRYLNDVRDGGMEWAVSRFMARMIGEEGMVALGRATNLSPADFRGLLNIFRKKINGMVGDTLGN